MEYAILEEDKNKIIFQLTGETHTFCNLLKETLLEDGNVKVASYMIEHPLRIKPKFIIETSKGSPIDALKAALKKIKKDNDATRKVIAKL